MCFCWSEITNNSLGITVDCSMFTGFKLYLGTVNREILLSLGSMLVQVAVDSAAAQTGMGAD